MEMNKVLTNASQVLSDSSQTTARNNISAFYSGNVAEFFSTSKTYKLGDKCIYQNTLYECIVEVRTAGDWTGESNWNRVNVVDSFKFFIAVHGETHYSDIKAALDSGKMVLIRYPLTQNQIIILQACEQNEVSNVGYIDFSCIQSGNNLVNDRVYVTRVSSDDTWSQVTYVEISAEVDLSRIICGNYNPQSTYNKNAYVLYENALYRCKEDGVTGEWNGVKWTAVHSMDVFGGATSNSDGTPGLVPFPRSADRLKFLRADGTWQELDLSACVNGTDLGHLIVALYDHTSAYSEGSYCIYGKRFYKCNTDIGSGGEEWNSSHWDEVSILDVIDSKISAIDLTPYLTETDLGNVVATIWNKTVANTVGQYVIHDKKLYRCIANTTANIDWDSNKWSEIKLTSIFQGATENASGVPGLVPAPSSADRHKFLRGDSTWQEIDLSSCVNSEDLGHLIVAAYNSSSTYEVGAFCIYGKRFYQCNTAITTAENWTPAHWTEVTIMEVIDAEIGAIDLTPYLTETDLGNVIATIWNKSTANTVGQYVIHDRKLYRCISNTTADANWDSSKWAEVKITDIFQGATSQVNGTSGLVPAPGAGVDDRLLTSGGMWIPLDYATDGEIEAMFSESLVIDGRTYSIVRIGNQWWMAENLDFSVSGITIGLEGSYPVTSAGYFNNNENSYGVNGNKDGLLYTWDCLVILSSNIPAGWRIPTKSDCETLMQAVGGTSTAGTKLKSTSGWQYDGNGTNDYEFNFLASGYWNGNSFDSLGVKSGFWTSTDDGSYAYYQRFDPAPDSNQYSESKNTAFHIRLVKDAT